MPDNALLTYTQYMKDIQLFKHQLITLLSITYVNNNHGGLFVYNVIVFLYKMGLAQPKCKRAITHTAH